MTTEIDTTVIMRPSDGRRRRRLAVPSGRRGGPVTVVAVGWIVLVVLLAILAPVLAPEGAIGQDLSSRYSPPSAEHLLGTDALGRDLWARVLFGARVTLVGAAIGTAVALAIGVPLGLIAGYFGGWVDRVTSFVSDLLMSVPLLLIILIAYAIFPNSLAVSMTIFGLFTSAPIFRIVRGATLTTVGELYVTAARSTGLSHLGIIARHVAPRLGGLIQVQASIIAALALATQVGLGFLGLDVTPPAPSWGGLIADATQGLLTALWPIVPPTAMVVLTILALGVLGDSGQEAAAARGSVSLRARPPARAAERTEAHRDDALLSVRGLSVGVRRGDGELVLVQDVNFEVMPGEVVGLVGESGAGKSVTARALLGLNGNAVTTGSALFDGVDLLSVPERSLSRIRGSRIGFVGQDPMSSLDPLYRVEHQLGEAVRRHHRVSRAEASRRVRRLLADVRIPDPEVVARRYPFELSGGLAQRAAIALALAGDPELLIADEPTTALDVTVQMEVLGLLQRLRRDRGLAIILVTHDWGVIADMCDRALTMYAGEVVEEGAVAGMFAHPRHPYTFELRRADPHLQPAGATLSSIPGSVPPPGGWPDGCRFTARCIFATEACASAHPELLPAPPAAGTAAGAGAGRHLSRCIRVAEIQEELDHVPSAQH